MTREDVLKEFSRPYQSHEDVGGPDADAMADEIVRLRRILAALREPNEAVSDAAFESFYGIDMPKPLTWAIRAAVAAAEQEVSDDAR